MRVSIRWVTHDLYTSTELIGINKYFRTIDLSGAVSFAVAFEQLYTPLLPERPSGFGAVTITVL